ncbi:MAG: hypothetical protein WBQ30_05560, partial [Thermoanaerobaculia bacterium]
GSQLTLILTANTDGGSEAIAFQNLIISAGAPPPVAIAFDMVGSTSQNLVSFTDDPAIPFTSAGDGFNKFQRGVSVSIPFAVVDDSAGSFPGDTLGIIKTGNTDEFFGIVDTNNGDTSGRDVVATWVFDISGASDLGLSIDMGAMGDFEACCDFFNWSYSIDSSPAATAFQSSVDEAASQTYTLESGTEVTLSDPMLANGALLTNNLTTRSVALTGTGSQLTLILTANTDGGSEAVAFQNLIISAGVEPPPPPPLVEIFEIQGDGLVSPFNGQLVTTDDNVVTLLSTDGFFMQTPAPGDGDVDTSDGVFVYLGSAPTVEVGDQVDVVGRVNEFFGFTEITDITELMVDGVGAVPAPVIFNATVPSPVPTAPSCAIEYECYEGMIIEILNGTVTGPNQRFSTDPVAEVHISAAPMRTFREPGILFPGMVGLPVWDGNPEVFELDPDKLGLANQIIPAGSSFSARGALGYEFGGYELWPNELTYMPAEIPQAVRERVAGEFTVGSLNMFRFFDDIDDPPSVNAQGQERDDFVVSTAEYQRRKAKLADYILSVLDAPDVLAVQEVEKIGVLEDLAVEIAAISDPTVIYTPILEEGNDIGTIDVGFMVRDTVTVERFEQLGYYETYFNPVDMTEDILHDRPPLLLEGAFELEFGSFPIAVMTVHNRSLSSIEDPVQGLRVRQKRYEQAVSIAEKVQALQVANPEIHFVVIGDFNGFEFTDGYVDPVGQIMGNFVPDDNLVCDPNTGNACDDLVDPDLANQTLDLEAAERYSFIFRGNAQALDHALTAEGLESFLAGLELGRGNADAAFDLINDDMTPLRSSDHDGLALFVASDADDDGVPDDVDVCPGTVIPESVPTVRLGVNRYALVDEDGIFDTTEPGRRGPGSPVNLFTVGDTGGCSCEQIIEAQHLGKGHEKFGCSLGAMRNWVKLVNP